MADISNPPSLASETTPTADETLIDFDEMMRVYTRACELVILEGDSKLSRTLKERAILRNALRQKFASLLADRDRVDARLDMLRECIEAYDRSPDVREVRVLNYGEDVIEHVRELLAARLRPERPEGATDYGWGPR